MFSFFHLPKSLRLPNVFALSHAPLIFNDFLKSIMGFGLLVILGSLPLSIYTAYAHDFAEAQ